MTRRAHLSWPALALSLSALGLAACNGDDGPRPPAAVNPVGGVTLAGTVGELLSEPISVRVADDGGSPLGGQIVTFTVEGGGTVTPAVDTTDNTGTASTRWRLGEAAGTQRLTATVAGVATSAIFTATATAGAPSSVAISTGNNQSAVAGAAVGTPPAVVVRDRFNNPVAGTSVFFTVAAGGGTVTGAGATTNSQGIAAVGSWTLGAAVGTNRLTALVLSNGVASNPITFTATATAGAAGSLAAVGSTSLSGTVGALVTPIPVVRVTDANGNPVVGTAVTFAASTGSSVVGATKNTDANGNASPDGWQLGTVVQNYTLTATVGTLPPVVFTAAARPAVASQVAITAGNNQTAPVGRTLPIDPAVRVTDSFGNPVAGLEVLFEVVTGGGSAVARRPVTNAQGIATVGGWTLGDDIGANTLRATVQAQGITGNPVLFTATATAGAPATVVVSAGNNQTATVGSPVAIAPSVIVRDNRGNPVPGTTVTFLIGSGGGTVTGSSATTNAAGIATVGGWTLGGTAGAQTLIARVLNLPDVTFNATATAGAAAALTAQTNTSLGTIVVASNQAAPSLPSVRVTDAQGNPVAGTVVTFALGNNASGTITGETQTTNANGIATLGSWTLPTLAGTASVVATIPNVTGVTFTATMVAAAPSRIVNSNTPTTWSLAANGANVVVNLRIQDQFGNNVTLAGVTLGLAVTGGATITSNVVTDGNGVASLTFAAGVATTTYTINASGPSGYTALPSFIITIAP